MTARQRRLPNFLFIGPDKTGSTWLHEILLQHPACYVPQLKDIYFFDRYYQRGLDWYASFFADAPATCSAIGELSHDYLFCPEAPSRIARDLPDVRLLTCLRDPADRTFSHYLYMVRSGRTTLPFDDALDEFDELVENSLYAKHLTPYFETFDAARVKVLYFDQLRADARAFAREVFDFLEIPFLEDAPYEERVLQAGKPRSSVLARAAKVGANRARDLGLATLVGYLKRSKLREWLYRPYASGERPRMQPETRKRLVESLTPDIRRLETLLGRSFEAWRTAP